MSGTYPMAPDTVRLLKSYIKSRKDTSPYLFISNRVLPIDRPEQRHMVSRHDVVAT